MTTLPPFRLSVMPLQLSAEPSPAPPFQGCLDLNVVPEPTCQPRGAVDSRAENPATSTRRGSFTYDRESGKWPYEWATIAEFDIWHRQEELAYSIELIGSTVTKPPKEGPNLWKQKPLFVCSRQWSGGKSKYLKKHPDRMRRLTSKKTGCRCKIEIKQYHHTQIIRGRYTDEHNHDIGVGNLQYTRISRIAREEIQTLLEMTVDPKEIVREQINKVHWLS